MDAFSATYKPIFMPPPTALSTAARANTDAADAVLAALRGAGVALTPPPGPDALPWRWRAEGLPELRRTLTPNLTPNLTLHLTVTLTLTLTLRLTQPLAPNPNPNPLTLHLTPTRTRTRTRTRTLTP